MVKFWILYICPKWVCISYCPFKGYTEAVLYMGGTVYIE
jgi:hypothetical protein